MRILLLEDDDAIAMGLKYALEKGRYLLKIGPDYSGLILLF